jgi:uncharacterized repeat protein (TIGR01451 family)
MFSTRGLVRTLLGLGLGAAAVVGVAPPPASAGIAHDASVQLTDGTATVFAGGTTTYTVTVSNTGSTAAGNFAPTFPGTVGAWTCSPVGGGAVCPPNGSGPINVVILVPGGTQVVFSVPVTIPSSAVGVAVAAATFATVGDTAPENDTAQDVDTIQLEADVHASKSDGVTSVRAGSEVTYTIVATNDGPSDTTARVVDTLPPELSGAEWTCVASGTATCPNASGTGSLNEVNIGLPNDTSVTYSLTAIVDANLDQGDTVTNTAVASATGAQDDEVNNDTATDTDTVVDNTADLVALKTGPATVAVGGTATYTIGVRNDGPDPAFDVVLADLLPTGTTFVSMTQATGPTATVETPAVGSGGAVVANLASLADGASATFTLVVQLGGSIAVGATVTNIATVDTTDNPDVVDVSSEVSAAATIDPTASNDAATTAATVVGPASTTTTTTAATSTTTTTTTARVGGGALPRTGGGTDRPVGSGLLILGGGLLLVGAAELRRLRATVR